MPNFSEAGPSRPVNSLPESFHIRVYRGTRVSARDLAASLLLSWETLGPRQRGPLSKMAEDTLSRVARLGRQDRALFRQILFGVVRWRSLLDWHIERLLKSPGKVHPLLRTYLRVGAFQILFLDRVPPSAAVNEAVAGIERSGASWAKGVLNAVLRRLARRREGMGLSRARDLDGYLFKDPVERLAIETSHPYWMVKRWVERYGPGRAEALCHENNSPAPLTIRVNVAITDVDSVKNLFESAGIEAIPCRYSPVGMGVSAFKGTPTQLPGFDKGWFQVQDEGAQLVSMCLGPKPDERILDACAGVGGKTTHVAELLRCQAIIHATDKDTSRLEMLRENAKRLGLGCITILRLPAFKKRSKGLSGYYDRVLLDAPCSGMGIIRRHPDIKWNRSQGSLKEAKKRQLALLNDLKDLVRPGGHLLYATCSLEPEETTEVLDAFLRRNPGWKRGELSAMLPIPARILTDNYGNFSSWPTVSGPDGFFASMLERCR